jgi:signal transduction histidine kinase
MFNFLLKKASFYWTALPIIAVVAASVIASLLGPKLSGPALAGVIGLALIYTLVAIVVFNRVVVSKAPGPVWLYFSLQFGLVTAIIYLSQGSGSLAIIPLAAQAAWISASFAVGVPLVLLLMVAVVHYLIYNSLGLAIQAFFSIGSALVFVFIFTRVLFQMEKSKQEVERLASELTEANRKLREYSVQVEELATTQERNRLAREIHDSLGHYFTVINVQIEAARAIIGADPPRGLDALTKAQNLTKEGLNEVRRSIAALRVSATENQSLTEAITKLVEDNRSAGIVTEFEVKGQPHTLQPAIEQTLYRAAQEGLTNIRKHAFASRVDLCLAYGPEQVKLKISDNGTGPTPQSEGKGFGLLGISERVNLLNGHLRAESAAGQGFTLEVEIPFYE